MSEKQKNYNADRLSFKKLMLWKSSDISSAGVSVIVLGYLTLYCTDTLGMNPALVGTLLLASKIFDAIADLFYGWLVDNTHTRFGKGRTYELCIIGMTLCTIGLFGAGPEWSGFLKGAWVFIMYTLVYSVFTSLRLAGQTPYCIRAFSNNQVVITKVASYGGIITMFGSIIISVVFPIVMSKLATSAGGWTTLITIFMIPLTLLGLLRFIFVKEDPAVDEANMYQKVSPKEIFTMFKVNKYVWLFAGVMLCYNVTTALGVTTYYFKWIIGNTALISLTSMLSLVVLPLMLIFPVIMRKIGTMGDMIAVFCIFGIIGYGIIFFSGSNLPGVLTGGILAAFSTLPLAYYGVLFVMKCCSYNEMKGLPRMDASAAILSNFTSNTGSAIGSGITGLLLGLAGYVAGENVAAQPDSAILMIRLLYSVVPAIFLVVIAVFAKAFAPLERKIPEWEASKKAELERENENQGA